MAFVNTVAGFVMRVLKFAFDAILFRIALPVCLGVMLFPLWRTLGIVRLKRLGIRA